MAILDFFKRGTREDQFAHAVADRLRQAGWPYLVVYLKPDFSLQTTPDGAILHLGNVYRDWLTYPRNERDAQLDRIVAMVLEAELVKNYADAEPRLRPIVRSLVDLQALSLAADPPTLDPNQPHQPLAGSLATLLAIDLPNSITFVTGKMLEDWGKTFEELFVRALDNLVETSPVRFELAKGGFHLSAYGDTYDTSRLLLPELILALQLRGDPIAVAVRRDQLAVAGAEDLQALQAMAEYVVGEFNTCTRPLSCMPMILREGRWAPVDVTASGVPTPLRELSVCQSLWEYGRQTPELERLFARTGRDVYVPPLEVLAHEDAPFCWVSWTENVPALLPRADGIRMTAADGRTLFRLWSDIEAVCGPFDSDASVHPPRYTRVQWPSQTEWLRLERDFPAPSWWPGEPA